MYSSLSRVPSVNSGGGEPQNLSFCKGLKLLETGCVDNVLQVGECRPPSSVCSAIAACVGFGVKQDGVLNRVRQNERFRRYFF